MKGQRRAAPSTHVADEVGRIDRELDSSTSTLWRGDRTNTLPQPTLAIETMGGAVGRKGLEPLTYGLKVRSSTD